MFDKNEQNRNVSSGDSGETHKEEEKEKGGKSVIMRYDASNNVTFNIGSSKTIENEEQSDHCELKGKCMNKE